MSRRQPPSVTVSLPQFGPQIINAGYFEFKKAVEFRYELHLHHLILIERGTLEALTPTGPIHGKANDFLCFRPTLNMVYRVVPGTAFYQVSAQFCPPPNHLLTPELPEIGPFPVQTPTGRVMAEFRKSFETICVELPQAGSLHHFRVQIAVYRMLAALAETLKESPTPPVPLDAWEHIRLRVASMEGGKLTTAQMAHDLGVSQRHFQRVFKQRFGMSPHVCRMHARLAEAVRRLRETDEPVKAIAYGLGFDGAKELTRALKKQLSLTASQIRLEPESSSTNLAALAPNGLFPSNQHILPPGDRLDLFWKRVRVTEKEL